MRAESHDHAHLWKHLDRLKEAPLTTYRPEDLREVTNVIDLGSGSGTWQRAVDACTSYRIFPERILEALAQWKQEGRAPQVGDTIVQRAHIPPIEGFSVTQVFGVRLLSVIDENDRQGFSYGTLKGHVEKGVSTFTVERSNGIVSFRIHTLSGPGTWYTAAVASFLTRPYQAYCTRKALEYVKAQSVQPRGQ